MRLLCIDPGTTDSAYVVLEDGRVDEAKIVPNSDLLHRLGRLNEDEMVIEMIEGLGMPVGKETFETVFWIGRFCQAWDMGDIGGVSKAHRIYRKEVKLHLCGNHRAKDANIRQALLDKLGPQGVKKAPGPTYGVSGHCWQALAVGVTWLETKAPAREAV